MILHKMNQTDQSEYNNLIRPFQENPYVQLPYVANRIKKHAGKQSGMADLYGGQVLFSAGDTVPERQKEKLR